MRLAAYAGTSMVLAAGVLIRALHERANFYSATVYLAQSSACLMILTNVMLLALGTMLVGLQRLLYGPLRPIEVEQLYERAWISLTETCLAMTIFRDEVGVWFIIMFVSLLIGKVWGWISEGRVDIFEQQPPANPRLFHARLSASLALSFLFDLFMLYYTVSTVRHQARPSMMVMFAFEFAVLTTVSMSTGARYCLSLREAAVVQTQTNQKLQEQRQRIMQEREAANREAESNGEEGPTFPPLEEELNEFEVDVPGWEEKGRWVFYLNIVTDFLKLVLYMTFFCVLCIFYGMPIHIVRDVAYTIQSFYKRITDFIKYKHATRDMNERYPDATAEQIGREETCIICREVMREWRPNAEPPMEDRLRPKKLPCGHVLHLACLRSWLERQQNCPTCRQNVLEDPPRRSTPGNRDTPAQGGENRAVNGQAPQNGRPAPRQNRNRLRFLNLGPLRLGFGAGNMQDLQREMQQQAQEDRRTRVFQRAFGLEANGGTQQSANQSTDITAQLRNIERQLITDMNINMLQAEQLRVVRAMQGELARLRIRQVALSRGDVDNVGLPAPPMLPGPSSIWQPHQGATVQTAQGYTAPQAQNMLGAGHPDLPQGLAIPEGWSLMPLEPINQNPPLGMVPQPPQSTQHSNQASSGGNTTTLDTAAPNPVSTSPTRSTLSAASNTPSQPSQQDPMSQLRHQIAQPMRPQSNSGNEAMEGSVSTSPAVSIEHADGPSQSGTNGFATSSSLPQWGSSATVPRATNGPSVSFASDPQAGERQTEHNEGKGKSKAPTVEDAQEDDRI